MVRFAKGWLKKCGGWREHAFVCPTLLVVVHHCHWRFGWQQRGWYSSEELRELSVVWVEGWVFCLFFLLIIRTCVLHGRCLRFEPHVSRLFTWDRWLISYHSFAFKFHYSVMISMVMEMRGLSWFKKWASIFMFSRILDRVCAQIED